MDQINNMAGAQATAAPVAYVAQPVAMKKPEDTPQTKRMKANFEFFGPVTFLYACFYAFCMFRNGSGITFPFFVAASLLYLCCSLSKLEITLKKGSAFSMISMMLLAVSTFCTDDGRIIFFNKAGIFLLVMSLLLNQFYDTSGWKLGKYLGSIFLLVFACIGELTMPFRDAADYFRGKGKSRNQSVWYVVLGVVIAIPLLIVVLALLSGADAVFRLMTDRLLKGINVANLFNVLLRVAFLFFAAYLLTAYLCKHTLSEKVTDRRKGEPVLAITVTGLLTAVYLVFSVIQILYLFLGKMQLPKGYTYSEYAREGFFQLLTVSILNLIIVLFTMAFFRESKILKAVLTVMSLCTFIMIASSALRMIIYIRFYYLTFLRILVLWGLAVLFLLFLGITVSIFREKFPLFGYSTVVVTVMYLTLSFAHPDYIIAAVNVGNAAGTESEFFWAADPYQDFYYLSTLSADAAPVLAPYADRLDDRYLRRLDRSTENFGIRTYNVSRHIALKKMGQR